MLNEDFTQPWYIPMDKRHLFRGINASGYLPPLETHIEKSIPEPQHKVIPLSSWDIKWRKEQLRSVEFKFEKLEEIVCQSLRIIERNKIPVKVIEIAKIKELPANKAFYPILLRIEALENKLTYLEKKQNTLLEKKRKRKPLKRYD